MSPFAIRVGEPADAPAIEALLPRLADFEAPVRLSSEEVWMGDARVVAAWAAGDRPNTIVRVATDAAGTVVGAAVGTMLGDVFTLEPTIHLEIVTIAERADGHGLGRELMAQIEAEGRDRGATVMSLNVMTANDRARAVYAKLGFDEEMIRCARSLTT